MMRMTPSPVLRWSAPGVVAVHRRARRNEVLLGIWSAIFITLAIVMSPAAHGRDTNSNAIVIGKRPAGCPPRFCGCEASLHVFGRIRPELNLAANWIKYFQRAQPAPGMAAARGGHVFILISHVSGNDWLVHDGNSGGGLTRRHVRSIRGYVIVNPHSSKHARAQ